MQASEIKSIGVVGAGTMGQGIAQVFICGGYEVKLFDAQPNAAAQAIGKIKNTLQGLIEKGKGQAAWLENANTRLHEISTLEELKADVIIEAIVENLEIKQHVFQVLESVNGPASIFCTNTSSLAVEKIFATCKNPTRCLGVHFFNPAPLMKLVELISTPQTDAGIVHTLHELLKPLGKVTVEAKDFPGFIVNRVARHYYLEAFRIVEKGGASIAEVDTLMKSVGFKMGPFELMDLIGVDVNLSVSQAVYEGFDKHPKFKPSDIQVNLVKEGKYGRKNGVGFYEYKK